MDDDSLSRRAAVFVAEWNWRTTIERLNESRTPQGGGYSGGGGGGASSAGAGTAIGTVLVISAIAGGFGGLSWFLGALMVAGTLVPTLLGGDIPLQEGVVTIGGLGAVLGVVVGAVRAFRR